MKKAAILVILLFVLLITSILVIYFAIKSDHNSISQNETNSDDDSFSQGCVSIECEKLQISNRNTSKTLDLVFIPAGNYSQEEFLQDVNSFLNVLFKTEPFSKYRSKFNFYIYKENIVCFANEWGSTTCGLTPEKPLSSLSSFNSEIGYFDIYLILEPRGGGGSTDGSTIQGKGKSPGTNIHELGHYFGLDEAYISYDSTFDRSTNVCSDFSCCGGKLCSQEILDNRFTEHYSKGEIGECCAPTTGDSKAYSVAYSNIMQAGTKQDVVFSERAVQIIQWKLENWRDCFSFKEGFYQAYKYDDAYYCGLE